MCPQKELQNWEKKLAKINKSEQKSGIISLYKEQQSILGLSTSKEVTRRTGHRSTVH